MHEKTIENHYVATGLADSVMDTLGDALKDMDSLKLEAFSPVDEFHIRGREATLEMIQQAQFTKDDHVLDVGCGVGGPSRWLAHICSCRVTRLDITEAFCKVATTLAQHTGMDKQVQYRHGNALDMPFDADSFDGVWMQHVNMNIKDKAGLFRESHRVLKPGGKLIFYEILADSGEPLAYPVPWTQRPEISFLISEQAFKDSLTNQGFSLQAWDDVTVGATEWFRTMIDQASQADPSVLTVRAQKDPNVARMTINMLQNLEQGKIRVVSGIAKA